MGTVINLPRDTRTRGIGKGIAEGLQAFVDKRDKKRRIEAFQKAVDSIVDARPTQAPREEFDTNVDIDEDVVRSKVRLPKRSPSNEEIASALAPFLAPGEIADILMKSNAAGARKAPRRITVFSKDGRQKEIEVPFDAPAISNVQQLGAVARGADLEGFSLTQPGGGEEGETEKGRLIAQLVADGVPRSRAFRLAHKLERIEIVPQSGEARRIDTVSGKVTHVKLSELTDAERNFATTTTVTPEGAEVSVEDAEAIMEGIDTGPQLTLMQLAVDGTGPWAALRAGLSRGLGLIGSPEFIPTADETINARQGLSITSSLLTRDLSSVSSSSRAFAEIQDIRDVLDIEPAIVDSPPAMQSRIVGAHRTFKKMITVWDDRANNLDLDPQVRGEARALAEVLRGFLPSMGVTSDQEMQSPGDVVPEGEALGKFAGMTRGELSEIDIDRLSDEEVAAYVAAWEALGAK